MTCAEATTDWECDAIDVGRFVGGQEDDCIGDLYVCERGGNVSCCLLDYKQPSLTRLLCDSISSQRIQLSNFPLRAFGFCHVKDDLGHARFNETRTDGVDSDIRA